MATEQELKFAVAPSDMAKLRHTLGAMSRRRPSRSKLVSTYFDTKDGALRKGDMTLRVRRKGRRFLQTVKSNGPAPELAAHGEWEDPISGQTPDLTARNGTLVRRAIGEASVAPLFTTTVRRSTIMLQPRAGTIIEAALDEGEIRAAHGDAVEPISELELELKSGDAAALYDIALRLLEVAPLRLDVQSKADRGYRLVARRRGPPPVIRSQLPGFATDATVETMLQEVGRACLGQLVGNEPAAVAGVTEGVHQMRVAIRRLRSALAAVKPMLSEEHYAWANGAAKSFATALGSTRDWDVLAEELLRPVSEAMPEEEELKLLSRELSRRRRSAYAKAKEAIAAPEYTATILRLGRWFEARAWRDQPVSEQSAALVASIKELAPALLARRHRQAMKRSKRFMSLAPPERHRLRIALKKLRYTIELLECLFEGKDVRRYLKSLKAMQNDLGHANDVRTAHEMLAPMSADSEAKAATEAAGIVLGWHMHQLLDQEKALRARVRRFRRAAVFW